MRSQSEDDCRKDKMGERENSMIFGRFSGGRDCFSPLAAKKERGMCAALFFRRISARTFDGMRALFARIFSYDGEFGLQNMAKRDKIYMGFPERPKGKCGG